MTSREGDCSGDAGRVSQRKLKPSALEQMGVQAGMSWAASALVQNRWKYHENEGSFLLTKYVRSIILDFEKFFHPIPSNPFYFLTQL